MTTAAVAFRPADRRDGRPVSTEAFDAQDRMILQCLRGQDQAGLHLLARKHGLALVRAAYLHLGDTHAAEDVAQDAIIAAWDSAPRAASTTDLRPWLFGILFNHCRNYRRSIWRRRRREHLSAQRRQELATEANPLDLESLHRLRQAMARLNEDFREVLILRYERELSVVETANALGVPEGTVKSRTFKAILLMRELMGKSNEE
jgi:RNA polymerase sigma-70 factor, ECF subfamily